MTLTTNVSSGKASLEIDVIWFPTPFRFSVRSAALIHSGLQLPPEAIRILYYDNLVIKQNSGVAGDKQYTGYSPDNDAPYLSDYTLSTIKRRPEFCSRQRT